MAHQEADAAVALERDPEALTDLSVEMVRRLIRHAGKILSLYESDAMHYGLGGSADQESLRCGPLCCPQRITGWLWR